jgi:hypothetical protein
MLITIIVLSALVLVAAASIALVTRDMGHLHRRGKSLADKPGDASGVSAAGMTAIGGNITHG